MNIVGLAGIIRSRRLDMERLSSRSGVSTERITAIVQGGDPSLGELRKLANALHVKISDLLPPEADKPTAQWLFRAVANVSADPSAVANFSRKIDYSMRLLGPASDAAPSWSGRFRSGTSYADADENAGIFRNLFCDDDQVGPLLFLPKIVVEKMGILLFVVDAAGLDGASAYFNGIPYIFVSNRFVPRMLFTLAHELGHILFHHDRIQGFAIFDAAGGVDESEPSTPGTGSEAYAHAFASCLLMPSRGVGLALKKIRDLHKVPADSPVGDIEVLLLSRIFGVSFVAAARRCEDLRLIPRGGARSLDEWLRKEYGSAEKRAETVGLPARPKVEFPRIPERLLVSAIEQIRAGKLSVGKASSVLGIPISDLMSANKSTVH